jgi:hypothetical protein
VPRYQKYWCIMVINAMKLAMKSPLWLALACLFLLVIDDGRKKMKKIDSTCLVRWPKQQSIDRSRSPFRQVIWLV